MHQEEVTVEDVCVEIILLDVESLTKTDVRAAALYVVLKVIRLEIVAKARMIVIDMAEIEVVVVDATEIMTTLLHPKEEVVMIVVNVATMMAAAEVILVLTHLVMIVIQVTDEVVLAVVIETGLLEIVQKKAETTVIEEVNTHKKVIVPVKEVLKEAMVALEEIEEVLALKERLVMLIIAIEKMMDTTLVSQVLVVELIL